MKPRLFLPLFILISSAGWAADTTCLDAYREAYNRHVQNAAASPQITVLKDKLLSSRDQDAETLYAFYVDTTENIAHESTEIDQLVAETGGSQTEIFDRLIKGIESGALCTADGKTKTIGEIAAELKP